MLWHGIIAPVALQFMAKTNVLLDKLCAFAGQTSLQEEDMINESLLLSTIKDDFRIFFPLIGSTILLFPLLP